MLELRMLYNILHCIHDLGNTGLVVCTKQGSAVCGNQGLTLVLKEFRELAWLEIKSFHTLERNLAAVIILYDLWLDVVSRSIRSCIDVGDESDSRNILAAV